MKNTILTHLAEAEETEKEIEKEIEKEKEQEPAILQRLLKTRTVILSGEIDKPLAEKVIRQLLLLEEENDKPIKVFIDSPGGDAYAGFAIFDMIRFVKPAVITIGMGLVASAASLVLLSASRENRYGLPHSHYLIHQPLSGIRGVATEIEIHARELDKLKIRLNKIISEETGKPEKKVEQDTDRDYWMNSEEAKTYGLISKVIKKRGELTK